MGKKNTDGPEHRKATTLEARENQLIALAVDLAEQKLRDGTASSQLITHYLRLGSSEERIRKKMLEEQTKLYEAKAESLQSTKRIEELYADAMKAFGIYSGNRSDDGTDLPEDDEF